MNFFFECYSDDAGYYHQDNIPLIRCIWKITVFKIGYNILYTNITIGENTKHDFVLSLSDTIFVDDDNVNGPWNGSKVNPYRFIWDGVAAAKQGNIVFVRNGTYAGGISVNKSIRLTGESKNSTTILSGIGSQSDDIGINITADYVEISDFTISSCWISIKIWSNFCNIVENNISGHFNGIELIGSHNAIVYNTISNNYMDGLIARHSSIGNNISYNYIYNTTSGIALINSKENKIHRNTFIKNDQGVRLSSADDNAFSGNSFTDGGVEIFDSYNNLFIKNTIDGKPLVYLEKVSNKEIKEDAGQIILIDCQNIKITNRTFSDFYLNLQMWDCNNCSISKNKFLGDIRVFMSEDNIFTNNEIYSLSEQGLDPIWMDSSRRNTISFNNISNGYGFGITLSISNDNHITNNNINNNGIGIAMFDSSGNFIHKNNIIENYLGVLISCKMGTKYLISQNNFIGNENDTIVLLYEYFNFPQNFNFGFDKLLKPLSIGLAQIKRLEEIPRINQKTIINNCCIHKWDGNYWDDKIGIGPKVIFCALGLDFKNHFIILPWLQIDWHPAKGPYGISA